MSFIIFELHQELECNHFNMMMKIRQNNVDFNINDNNYFNPGTMLMFENVQ